MRIGENKQQAVGALVFIAFLFAVGVAYQAGKTKNVRANAGSYLVRAGFNRIDGLRVGDDVMLGGVKIGRVAAENLGDNYRAILTLELYDTIALPADTSAAIHTDGLFGAKHIALEPGGGERTLKDGEEILYTQDSVVVGDLLDLIIGRGRAKLASRKAGESNR